MMFEQWMEHSIKKDGLGKIIDGEETGIGWAWGGTTYRPVQDKPSGPTDKVRVKKSSRYGPKNL